MAGEFVIKTEGGKKQLIINYKGAPYGADIAQYAACMKDVVQKLREVDADEIVLSEYYERIYNEEQTRMLKGIGDLVAKFESETVWSPSNLGTTMDSKSLAPRHDAVMQFLDLLPGDPFRAYLYLLQEIKTQITRGNTLGEAALDDLKVYIKTLAFLRSELEKTEMINAMKKYLLQLSSIPADRNIYHTLFEAAIKPSFIGSRIFFTGIENLELIDQYEVMGSKVYIYKHPEKVELLYYINPPEYTLAPDKYFLLEKTKEVVSAHRPSSVSFLDMQQARRYFKKIYMATINDLATANGIKISADEKDELATIVSRYTIGYGILEIILSDRQLTDVYIDSPLGEKPIYLVHSKYGQCQTNIIFSEEEAKSLISRFRALSGRPFDEAHPILDFDLPDLQTRIAAIGKPLAVDGTAFALRLHKETPWTLAQFMDFKMFGPVAAGMLSFMVDAQASTLIVGSRGAGKTSLLQAMMQEISPNLRIIVQEDTLELPVHSLKRLGFSIQRLKTRAPLGAASEADVSAEDALRTALRLGDSVLIVGEVRSGEARALFEAMRVGAVGNVVMGTIHGESAYSIWDRIVNDLGVPTTSFKATDFAVVATQIRFKGSLKRARRLIEITEVKKHWTQDPDREDGFLNWMQFDAGKDDLDIFEDKIKDSEWMKKLQTTRGLKPDQIWAEIRARADAKQYLVDLKRKYQIPKLLEAENTLPSHSRYMLIAEKQREETGSVNHADLLKEWKFWVDENIAKPLMRK
ncbi:MAG: type II/IV secretion system ATPase subunit [Candidatus Micrarchaeota archaeon]